MNQAINIKDLHKIFLNKLIKALKEKHVIKEIQGVFKNENKSK